MRPRLDDRSGDAHDSPVSDSTSMHRRPSPSIVPVEGVLKRYDWGDRGKLAGFLELSVDPEPVAEWWLGTHADGPAIVRGGGKDDTPISSLVGDLPWMLKVLAIGSPLSLQAHPDARQARAGFDEEVRREVPPDARRFRDPNAKPELLVALEPTRALAGIRPAAETIAAVEGLRLRALDALLEPLREDPVGGPGRRLATLLAMPPERARTVIAAAVAAADTVGREAASSTARAATLIRLLGAANPDDPAVLAALLLHDLDLAPGEAIFIAPRMPHAYIEGFGLELMASSDNVVRGGLSRKPVDAAAFLATIDATPGPPPLLAAAMAGTDGRGRLWHPDGVAFGLTELGLDARAGSIGLPVAGPAIALGLDGSVTIRSDDGAEATLSRGTAVLIVGGSTVHVEGQGRVAVAASAGR